MWMKMGSVKTGVGERTDTLAEKVCVQFSEVTIVWEEAKETKKEVLELKYKYRGCQMWRRRKEKRSRGSRWRSQKDSVQVRVHSPNLRCNNEVSEKSKNNKEVDDNTVEVVALSRNNESKEDVPENSENIKKDVEITVEVVALTQNSKPKDKAPENSKNTKEVDSITMEVVPISPNTKSWNEDPESEEVVKEGTKFNV